MMNKKTLRKYDNHDLRIQFLSCRKCGMIIPDGEPWGAPYFFHKENPKRYCPNEGKCLEVGMPGVAEYRSKKSRRARKRGAKLARKATRKATNK
jgi:hypothetical protein